MMPRVEIKFNINVQFIVHKLVYGFVLILWLIVSAWPSWFRREKAGLQTRSMWLFLKVHSSSSRTKRDRNPHSQSVIEKLYSSQIFSEFNCKKSIATNFGAELRLAEHKNSLKCPVRLKRGGVLGEGLVVYRYRPIIVGNWSQRLITKPEKLTALVL